MLSNYKLILTLFTLLTLGVIKIESQIILPPLIEWHGKSEAFIVKPTDLWITPVEKSNFITTPDYSETMAWLKKLTAASPLLKMVSIGISPEGRDIMMIIASSEKSINATTLKNSEKPLMLVQAGIHAGEIDGKDAGLMLLRDIVFGNKKNLLDKVNFLFIPILNVDGHERSSSYNRPNQRGPQNMGWRTNSQNLNLNRDYSKLDTKEIRSVLNVINEYEPTLYLDIHVTDGADYQYDITYSYGGLNKQAYSPACTKWMETTYTSATNKDLKDMGHIPGAFLNAVNGKDFSEGNEEVILGANFSHNYGDLRHLPSILVETHSLKPYKQRVLGTYVLLESSLKLLAVEGKKLKEFIQIDKSKRETKLPVLWKIPQLNSGEGYDTLNLLGITSQTMISSVTNAQYVEWTGKPITMKIPNFKGTDAVEWISRPKAYWIPASCFEIIERLKMHGIKMEVLKVAREVDVEMYRIHGAEFKGQPYEGHVMANGKTIYEIRKQLFPVGSVCVLTDQYLGDLAMVLLEPNSASSFFKWGFFLQIFQKTEYMEGYILEPMIKKMLEESTELKKEFELKKQNEPDFAKDPNAIMRWFYKKTKYYDERFLLYPVGREI